ncbi:MAG: Rieske 2Fe-2S domain-containing protein [Acidimicrobiales bacterium]
MTDDPIVDEWFPVAAADHLEPGSWHPLTILDERILLVVDREGKVSAFPDTCPHRGAQLSLGSFDGVRVQCPYHGWQFDADGRCAYQPAHPDRDPQQSSGLRPLASESHYGLLWVCLGPNPRNIPLFEEFSPDAALNVVLEPARLASSGPRIVENFLDLAHFPFVHDGYLGQPPNTAIDRYGVEVLDGILRLSDVAVWQPNPGPKATSGGPVSYQYSVSHPYAATLTKTPSPHDGGDLGGFSILLAVSPKSETECVVWRVVAVRDPDLDQEAQRRFNKTIFEQDVPVVESQLPKLLPLEPRAEQHQPADAGSLAYRKWLTERGITYGTT